MSNLKTVYPRTKFADENSVAGQLKHLESEFLEAVNAYNNAFNDKLNKVNYEPLTEEICDLIHSAETLLHILAEKHGVDVAATQRAVVEKNRERGYYPACEKCAAPRCAKAECIVCREYQCCADLEWHWCNEKCVDFIPKEVAENG